MANQRINGNCESAETGNYNKTEEPLCELNKGKNWLDITVVESKNLR